MPEDDKFKSPWAKKTKDSSSKTNVPDVNSNRGEDYDTKSPQNKYPAGRPLYSRKKKPSRNRWMWILGLISVGYLVYFLTQNFSLSEGDGAYIIYDLLLLVFIGAGLFTRIRANPGQALQHAAGWVIIAGVLMLGYSFWSGSGIIGQNLSPTSGFEALDDKGNVQGISYRANERGHYVIKARVNGVVINFLLDTGASDVSLTLRDAEKIGYDLDHLKFTRTYVTANGTTKGAVINIREIEIGPIKLNNIDSSVMKINMGHSLLGMTFLKRLSGYEVRSGVLTLYP